MTAVYRNFGVLSMAILSDRYQYWSRKRRIGNWPQRYWVIAFRGRWLGMLDCGSGGMEVCVPPHTISFDCAPLVSGMAAAKRCDNLRGPVTLLEGGGRMEKTASG